MKTLFLNPPSFQGFDGGAGSRYQARREIRSFWYPTWLAQAAALVPDSKLVDAPADGLCVEDVLRITRDYELVVIYTSTPSFSSDARTAVRIKRQRPETLVAFVGPHVSVLPEESLRSATGCDFVVRKEFEMPVKEVAQGRPLREVPSLSWRDGERIAHNNSADTLTDLDSLPFVVDVYKRDLTIENYLIGYLLHPYLSLYTGRGCPSRCTFCLWPQTMSGHSYRVRSPESVYRELARARDMFLEVKEYFLDDDTFTADPERAEQIARKLATLGITWSTSSRANVPFDTLKTLRECGLRLVMVGYESGSDEILRNVRKGITTDMARRFTRDCKSLGIAVHGTFMLGLPGETPETIEQTIRYACELDPDTMQVSVVAPYPGTELYEQALQNGWLAPNQLVATDGTQVCPMVYERLSGEEILSSVGRFYKRFYFRPKVMARIGRQMAGDADVRRRRLREGREFFSFLGRASHTNASRTNANRTSANRAGAKKESLLRRVLRDGGPSFCQFAITDACNARCKFCNFSADSSPAGSRVYVPTDEACAALDVLSSNGCDYIAFVGGEPTMHSDLPVMIAHAKVHGMKTMVCTNGALLTDDRLREYIDAGLDDAIVSIDAPSIESHEENRALPGVCGRITRANTTMRDAGVSTTASVTISRLLCDLNELPGFLRSLGFEQVTFSYPLRALSSSFKGYSDSDLIEYTRDELWEMFEEIKKLKKSFHVVNPTASLEEMQRFVRGEKQCFPCLAGYKYFYLDWEFDLYRCHAWPEPMCSVFDLDASKLVRDGCTCCMIDCYRDASVLHEVGMALFDSRRHLANREFGRAISRFCNRTTFFSVKSVVEDLKWIRGL